MKAGFATTQNNDCIMIIYADVGTDIKLDCSMLRHHMIYFPFWISNTTPKQVKYLSTDVDETISSKRMLTVFVMSFANKIKKCGRIFMTVYLCFFSKFVFNIFEVSV